jgi:hypothetical protein
MEQVVARRVVALGFEVFLAVVDGYNYPHRFTAYADEEAPFIGFDIGDGLLLSDAPALPVMGAADMGDAFVRIGSIAFVDALDLNILRHGDVAPTGACAEGMGAVSRS